MSDISVLEKFHDQSIEIKLDRWYKLPEFYQYIESGDDITYAKRCSMFDLVYVHDSMKDGKRYRTMNITSEIDEFTDKGVVPYETLDTEPLTKAV